ncbi:MFS transporter [Sphingomonas donggukensis]|uniref:MFS transporter n=1 Tax=Sphingomonas donggukensis TaxID=2949093 RepID=A0ABY4TZE7_9SPHN|nr:MFS transporter [Sphingomonas donggukensis]URW77026.1 MFS transporter [Sphingomonas donggukensis]
MTEQELRARIDAAPMSPRQIGTVATMIALNALDGFDVLSVSFASPGIASEWGIDRAALGIVLSMELVGMAFGALLLGRLADKVGRRSTILGCLIIMATGMAGAAMATSIIMLCWLRLVTGLGIGGMLAATNAAVAEAANGRWRNLCVVLMAAGYPLGAVLGGGVASYLLAEWSWRAVFVFGAVITALSIPLVLVAAPESIGFLIYRRPANALVRVNAALERIGLQAIAALPATARRDEARESTGLFDGSLRARTALLTIAYFGHILTYYFVLKWIPKIVVDMGFPAPAAGGVLVWANVGGLTGAVLLGLLATRVRLINLLIATLAASAVMVTVFGWHSRGIAELARVAAIVGFFTNAGVVGLYALVASLFPTEVRASATGFVIGIGRGGAALAPALAGTLFASGVGLSTVATLMALGSFVAAVVLLLLRTIVPR